MATVQDINNRENIVEVKDEALPVASDTTFNSDTVNTESLLPPPTTEFETLLETEPTDISTLDPTPIAPLGEPQQEASDLTTEIQGLYDQTLGESAFQAEQEDEAGIAGLQATQTDLEAQLKGLINEQKAIPLQLQQESIGRGRTAGGIAPIQTARLRDNAIKALTVNSLLESSRGNLSTALSLVDRAVAQKFDPIKEEIAVKLRNLELIRNSESYTQAERKQAQEQIDIQNKLNEEAIREEVEQTAIWNMGVEAAKSGLVDTVTLNAIQNAKTKEDALQLMVDAGIYASTTDDALTLKEGEFRFEKDASGNYVPVAGISKPTEPKDFIQTVGDTLLQYDEATGEWDTIFTKPEQSDASETSQYKNWKLAVADGSNLTFTEWMGKQNPGEMSSYMQQMNTMILDTVGELEGMTNNWTTGAGGLLSSLPASDARNFKAKLSTLKANIGFGALTSMREASKTGGALGQVSNIELGLLTSTLGGLDQLQTAEQFDAELKKVRDSITRWQEAIKNFGTGSGAVGDIEDFEWELE